ncbi:sensor histidine kinase [Planctobacterium marinum]|uniref:histidine kinase n=1 Tax=Planctobacterium marinum TaxID=1631968 RepID=A0AA48I744_9ALTE|nr:hypothetical protein MACH26_26910 [Planctobacterium marinum]
MNLQLKLQKVVLCCTLFACIPTFYLLDTSVSNKLLLLAAIVFACWQLSGYALKRFNLGMAGLETGLLNFLDGEYASLLSYDDNDELGHLSRLYNQTAEKLRAEKHWIYQRELMLDKVLQNSPEVLVLINDRNQVVFSNWAARHFFHINSTKLEGLLLSELLENAPQGVSNVIEAAQEGLFSISHDNDEQQTWHLATGQFLLNNQQHQLYILKQMTRELSRQEVAVWKKVIRIISHELNNSLGPISSMLNSGKLLTEQVQDNRLNRVFNTIEERIQHLVTFVQGYGKFAKLPSPKLSKIHFNELAAQLAEQWAFNYDKQQDIQFNADPIQLEQLLINLLKNAHESGSDKDEVNLTIRAFNNNIIIEVLDRGKGMSDSVLSQALIPFYSTKNSGSGLGLALCREIAEAHHGHIALQNRKDGGLCVRVSLPGV